MRRLGIRIISLPDHIKCMSTWKAALVLRLSSLHIAAIYRLYIPLQQQTRLKVRPIREFWVDHLFCNWIRVCVVVLYELCAFRLTGAAFSQVLRDAWTAARFVFLSSSYSSWEFRIRSLYTTSHSAYRSNLYSYTHTHTVSKKLTWFTTLGLHVLEQASSYKNKLQEQVLTKQRYSESSNSETLLCNNYSILTDFWTCFQACI